MTQDSNNAPDYAGHSGAHTPGLPDAWLHDGEWARVGGYYIYPRDDGQFYIGKPSGALDYYDIDLPGFDNMQAAIDHARWLVEEDARAGVIVSGYGYQRAFTEDEMAKIERERKAMRIRLGKETKS